MHRRITPIRVLALIAALFLVVNPLIQANAYIYTGYVMDNPLDIEYQVGGNAGQFASIIISSTETWETYCPEIKVSGSSDQNIYFYSNITVDNGTYAVCYPGNADRDKYTITFYKSFVDAPAAVQSETVVHEVGHALGLAHCQANLNSISVMRETGFNGKAYPLADDRAGIANLYR